MYYEHFGLNQAPFKITPDTNLFFPGGNRGAILEALIYAIVNGEGIVKVVGEVGTGKTMLCRMLEKELADNIEVVYLANPSLSPDQIPYAIAFELDLNVAASDNRLQVMNGLQDYLLKKHMENRQVVVFVEEAQAMSIESLEELRLLSNLETGQNKLLQIVLFGQPELDDMIAKPEIRQLKERITYTFQLSPFKNDEIKEYINSRLRSCGYRLGDAFHPSAIKAINKYSKGLLRRINILSDKSLLAAYASNTSQVTGKHVKIAAKDSEFISANKQKQPVTLFLGRLFLVIIVLCLLAFIGYFIAPSMTQFLAFNTAISEQSTEVDSEEREAPAVNNSAEVSQMVRDLQPNRVEDDIEEVALAEDIANPASDIQPSDERVVPRAIVNQHTDEHVVDVEKENLVSDTNDADLLDLEVFFKKSSIKDKELSLLRVQMQELVMKGRDDKKQSAIKDSCTICEAIVFKTNS